MVIRLERIGDEPLRWQETLNVAAQTLGQEQLTGLTSVAAEGELERVDAGFLLQIHLVYEQTLTCPRCLEPSPERVDARMELLVVEGAEEPMTGEHELETNELNLLFVEDGELDTEPILLELLQLNVPMRKLCRPDCAGICPGCGADLNRGSCSCGERPSDPRWAALATMRDRLGH